MDGLFVVFNKFYKIYYRACISVILMCDIRYVIIAAVPLEDGLEGVFFV